MNVSAGHIKIGELCMRTLRRLTVVMHSLVCLLCGCASSKGATHYDVTLLQPVDYREQRQGMGPVKTVRVHTSTCEREISEGNYEEAINRVWCGRFESDESNTDFDSLVAQSQRAEVGLKKNPIVAWLLIDLPTDVEIGQEMSACYPPKGLVALRCNAQRDLYSTEERRMRNQILREFFLIRNVDSGELILVDSVNHAISPRWTVLDRGAFDRLGRYFFYEKPTGAFRFNLETKRADQIPGIHQWLVPWNADNICGYNKDSQEFVLFDSNWKSLARVSGRFAGDVVSSYMIDGSTLLYLSEETGMFSPVYYLNVVDFETKQYRRLCEAGWRSQILEAQQAP